jgi:archaellin
MSENSLTERDHLTIELALIIEDPAGIEQIDLAAVVIEVFANRSGRQCELMRQSLWRWAQQWPRNCPETERSPKTAAQKPEGS